MRLDHLLSKEHLQQPFIVYAVVWCCQEASPLRRRLFCGGCSWVEYQRICRALGVLFFSSTNHLCGSGTVGRGVLVVGYGTLLGPEATGPCGGSPGGGCCVGLCFWFPCRGASRMFVCGVCGVGLLFENYIVDASILYKKQFPRL